MMKNIALSLAVVGISQAGLADSDYGIGQLLPSQYVSKIRKGSEDKLPPVAVGEVYQAAPVSRPITPFFPAQPSSVLSTFVLPKPAPIKEQLAPVPVADPIIPGPDPLVMKPSVDPTPEQKVSNRLLAGIVDPAPQAVLTVEIPKGPPQSDTLKALNSVLAYHEKYDTPSPTPTKKRAYWSNPDPSSALKSILDNSDAQHAKLELGESGTSVRSGNANASSSLYQSTKLNNSFGSSGTLGSGGNGGALSISLPFALPQLPMASSTDNTQN